MRILVKSKRIIWMFLVVQSALILYCLYFSHFKLNTNDDFNPEKSQHAIVSKTKQEQLGAMSRGKSGIDNEMKQYLSSVESNLTCKERKIRLSEKALPLVALLSFPGSGSTWLRHLIQQMTGIGTSSVYCDGGLRNNGFPFECYPGNRTIVVKTHLYGSYRTDELSTYQKLILLIRNPCDAILSYLQFATAGHTGHGDVEKIISVKEKLFTVSTKWYKGNIRKARDFPGPLHIVQYESLKRNLFVELVELAGFLYPSVTREEILCTVKHQEGSYHRKSNTTDRYQLMKRTFSEMDMHTLNNITMETEKELQEFYGKKFDLKCL